MHHDELANGESHNFTAEVLLREGTGSWSLPEAQRRAMSWMRQQGLPIAGVRVADGSGLVAPMVDQSFVDSLDVANGATPLCQELLREHGRSWRKRHLALLLPGLTAERSLPRQNGND